MVSKYLTVSEVARRLGLTRMAIHKRIKNRQITAEKIGNRYLIPEEEFRGLVAQELTDKIKVEIEKGVARVVKEYGETLRLLGKE